MIPSGHLVFRELEINLFKQQQQQQQQHCYIIYFLNRHCTQLCEIDKGSKGTAAKTYLSIYPSTLSAGKKTVPLVQAAQPENVGT